MPTLTAAGLEFVAERHLATLTTLRVGGTPHVTAVGFTWDADARLARVICSGTSQKATNAARRSAVAICQVDGRRWLTIEGTAEVRSDAAAVAEAVEYYTARYRPPRVNPERVAIVVHPTRLLGSSGLIAP